MAKETYACTRCDRSFTHPKGLALHVLYKHNPKKAAAAKAARAATMAKMQEHAEKIASADQALVAATAELGPAQLVALDALSHDIKCDLCGLVVPSLHHLGQHRRWNHSGERTSAPKARPVNGFVRPVGRPRLSERPVTVEEAITKIRVEIEAKLALIQTLEGLAARQ